MVEKATHKHHVEAGVQKAHQENMRLPSGYENPHSAALEDNPAEPEKLTLPVILSVLFLGTSFTGPIMFGFILVVPILVQLSQKIGGANTDFWIPSGWGAAAAVAFSVAGRLSDIFGRRPVTMFGQLLTIIGGIVACTSNTMNQLIAGEVILGASIGTVSVAYAGEQASG
jgi:MFS family permease